MKTEKSAGKSRLAPIEAYKLREDLLWVAKKPHYLILERPKSRTHVVLSILPLKGDLFNPNKWRGIALLDIASKATSSIIATQPTRVPPRMEEQAGSVPDKGCADVTVSLKLGTANATWTHSRSMGTDRRPSKGLRRNTPWTTLEDLDDSWAPRQIDDHDPIFICKCDSDYKVWGIVTLPKQQVPCR